ncbi:MAG: TRAP transporter large permease [Anaerotignum sp.]|nr:TRAP transporter large permease [Anaerotignum sp.]
MIGMAVVFLLIFIILGVPVAFSIGFSGFLALVFGGDVPAFMAVQQMVKGINSFPLMACPLFILAGEIMGGAKLSDRIIDFARELVSWMKGGVGCVCVVANMIFSAITGSGAAAISAVGGLTAPELKKIGYKSGFVSALIAGAGALGPIIPPSMNMIVYGSITGDSVGKLFIGGIMPGVIIGVCLMVMCFLYSRKYDIDGGSGDFSVPRLWKAFRDSFFAMLTPLIIIGGVITGIFTTTEAGVIACVYGLACGLFIYRTITFKDLFPIFRKATESSCMVMMIMGIATIYSYIFAVENVGAVVRDFLLSITTNPTIMMIMIACLMLVVGMFMETLAAMSVLLPLLYPVVMQLGCDPIQFGVMFTISTVMGGLSPPVGVYLFQSMGITGATFKEVVPYMIPVVLIVLGTMFGIIFFPGIATFLPNLLMG